MAERWQCELTKLRRAELPTDLWDRVAEGPRLEPLRPPARTRVAAAAAALAVFAGAAVLVWAVFAPSRPSRPVVGTLAGPGVLGVPPRGAVATDFTSDGRPVFVVHHEDGAVSVVDAFSSHRAWGFNEWIAWCPTTREFVETAHEAHFDEFGRYQTGGPAPTGLATFAFDVVERDVSGDPSRIRVGAMEAPDPGRSLAETDPSTYPALCPSAQGESNELTRHTIEDSKIWDSPAEAVAAAPSGWIAVRGGLVVASDGFVQLCSAVEGEECRNGAIVRGIDGLGLLVNVLRPYPGSAYETPGVWLAQVRSGVLGDLTLGGGSEDPQTSIPDARGGDQPQVTSSPTSR